MGTRRMKFATLDEAVEQIQRLELLIAKVPHMVSYGESRHGDQMFCVSDSQAAGHYRSECSTLGGRCAFDALVPAGRNK